MTKAPKGKSKMIDTSNSRVADLLGISQQFYASDSVVADNDVTVVFLQEFLAKHKVIASLDEDGGLEVREGFGPVMFINVVPKRHWIVFHTSFSTPSLDEEQRRDFSGYLNGSLAMAQFVSADDGVNMDYFMYYRGGLNLDQFMGVAQRFGSLAFTVIRQLAIYSSRSSDRQRENSESDTIN